MADVVRDIHGARLCVRSTPAAARRLEVGRRVSRAGSVALAAATGLRHSRAPKKGESFERKCHSVHGEPCIFVSVKPE